MLMTVYHHSSCSDEEFVASMSVSAVSKLHTRYKFDIAQKAALGCDLFALQKRIFHSGVLLHEPFTTKYLTEQKRMAYLVEV